MKHLDYRESRIILTLDPRIDIVTEYRPFELHNPDDGLFTRIDLTNFPKGLILPKETRFLASTFEETALDENHIGELQMFYRPVPAYGMTVHPNCPFQMPGSRLTMVLECRTDTPTLLKAHMPVAAMRIWEMNSPATYQGRYSTQKGIVRSRAHEGL
jgi:deoxycytidine triphosphate deaminase